MTGPRAPRPARARVAAVAGAVVLVGLGVALVAPQGPGAATAPALPDELVGLAVQRSAAAEETSSALAERLSAEPSVREVAVGAYAGPGRALVVLDVAPRTAFTDTSAGELTARLLGPGAAAEDGDGVRSAASDDGRALLTCRDVEPGTALCLSVEADRALVVLVTDGGPGGDGAAAPEDAGDGTTGPAEAVRLTADVRDEVRAYRTP